MTEPPAPRGPLPLETPVTEFRDFVPAELLERLTPAAASLTKQDLLLLDAGEFTQAARKLTVEDLNSLRSVFGETSGRWAKAAAANGYYCCCCCCYFCCCCTAVSVSKPLVSSRSAAGVPVS
jgi:hypothetical protein